MTAVINFSHLEEEFNFFPCSCISGFYFLWNSRLSAPVQKMEDVQAIVRNELNNQKTRNQYETL